MTMPDPQNRFICRGKLKDEKIASALHQAAEDYENGEIVEVMDIPYEIIEALTEFCEKEG